MKKSLIKNNFKSIIKTRRRFISILVMAFLGVGFYAGLVATSPDMLNSLDKYVDESNMFDIDVISTLGLTEDDVKAIKEIPEIEDVYGIQTKDSMAKIDDKDSTCKVIEYNENINTPTVVQGRLPENSNECLLDEGYSLDEDLSQYIGKKITLENDDKDEEDNPIFTQKEYTVVGIAESPLYISSERGNTSIGSGSISFYIYTKDDVINMDYYTEICATVKGAKDVVTNSDEYLELVNPVLEKVENIKEEREEARYNQLVNEANKKLEEAQQEFDSKSNEVNQELADGENQINEAKNQINNSEATLNKSEKEITTQEANAKKQFTNAESQIKEAEEQIESKEKELESGKQQLEQQKNEANTAIQQINEGITTASTTITALQEQKNNMEQAGLDTSEIDAILTQTQTTLTSLQQQKTEIENQIKTAEDTITNGETEINNAKTELQKQKSQLASSKKTTNTKIANAKKEITNGRAELETAKIELAQKEQEFEDGKREAQEQLNEAQQQLNDAKDQINQIEKAKWYIQDRLDNTGYTNMFDAIKTMENISKMFPVIFYIVAVLISLTSMTRMIEEERTEIGTLKSLGYNNIQIISKYILYSFLACVIGGVIGMSVGFYLLPNVVWKIYSMIYTMPNFYTTYQLRTGLTGILIAFICIVGATLVVSYSELKQMPAILMRPKSPKNGRKIFLEKIPFIWKRFNFSQKVTIRNIFRYKKRAIMTVVGIAGCTGLMLTGFGLKDSVTDIPDSQFGKIFTYESAVSLLNTNGLNDLKDYLNSNENIEDYAEVDTTTGKLSNDNSNYDVSIFVPNDTESFNKVCNLIDSKTDENITLNNNGIVITDKVAEFLNVSSGDEITLISSDNIEYTFKIEAITENYVSHYVYMTKEFYETNIKTYSTNTIFINTKEMSNEEINKMSENILNIDGVASVSSMAGLAASIRDMLGTMNYVVIILIVASALLAFVVLYNLANINIGERQREIATLKVLGFHDKEVDNYINKENLVFTVIGIILGLGFGVLLTHSVVASVEIDYLRFIRNIKPLSYVYSAAITLTFSLIVNKIIHFILKKIDMIESLKSVE